MQFYNGIAFNLSTRDVAHLLKSGKVYLLWLPEFSTETSTLNLNVTLLSYQAHLVLYEVSHDLYLATNSSQLPFLIQLWLSSEDASKQDV